LKGPSVLFPPSDGNNLMMYNLIEVIDMIVTILKNGLGEA
jgi:hypothetical protein